MRSEGLVGQGPGTKLRFEAGEEQSYLFLSLVVLCFI